MNELGLIDAFLAPFGVRRDARPDGAGVLSGPGDDCAVVRPSAGKKLVLKVDELVEGVHFDWRWFAPADAGPQGDWTLVKVTDKQGGSRKMWTFKGIPVYYYSFGTRRG